MGHVCACVKGSVSLGEGVVGYTEKLHCATCLAMGTTPFFFFFFNY